MSGKMIKAGLGTLASSVLFAIAAMVPTATTAYGQSGKRVCVSVSGGGHYIIEVNTGARFDRHWSMDKNHNAKIFKDKEFKCEEIGRWGSSATFGLNHDDVCDNLKTANRRSRHWHSALEANGYGHDYISRISCPDFIAWPSQLLWCENHMQDFKQVTKWLYHRKRGVDSNAYVATGQCRDEKKCWNPGIADAVEKWWDETECENFGGNC